ncbi:hypothetical protein GDO81_000029 [Engystomops pustulosus]|uniref:Ig-like domain-containing protein n=1 Tax=Engystomops pustulosus TaxID=76066 RepID=A0AAV7D2D0_ENGPU|nr:hypothetical protein GDO81_000029 [Engystomops pustulosus]
MVPLRSLLCLLYMYIQGSCGEVVVTQSPGYISASPGEEVTISCRVSQSIYSTQWKVDLLAWHQLKSRQTPKRLIYDAYKRSSGVPDRFSGSGSQYDFSLTIRVTEDDAADYYCQQHYSFPLTQ